MSEHFILTPSEDSHYACPKCSKAVETVHIDSESPVAVVVPCGCTATAQQVTEMIEAAHPGDA